MHPRDMLRILDELYGVHSLQELDNMKAQLEIPIEHPEEWIPLWSLHKNIHHTLARHNRVVDEESKISYMMRCVKPIGLFDFAIRLFENERPIGDRLRTFGNFCIKLNNAHANIPNETLHTAASLFSSNKSILKRPAAELDESSSNFVRSSKRSNDYAGAASTSSTPAPNSGTLEEGQNIDKAELLKDLKAMMAKEKKVSSNHYCWTHGTGNHDSKLCRYPKPGHVETADIPSPGGGSTHKYKKK